MKSVLGLMAVVSVAGAASAQTLVSAPVTGSPITAMIDGLPRATDSVTGYDNWTPPGSALLGLYNNGTHEVADDIHMIAGSAGLLDSMGLSVANNSTTDTLVTGTGTVRFYNFPGGTFINGFNFNMPTLNAAPGASFRLSFAAGSLLGLNINLPQDFFASLQWTAATYSLGTGTIANMGIQIRGPVAIGNSADGMIDVTTSTNISFGGNPPANTAFFFVTNAPAPGSLALLGLSGLFAARRRR
jgi:hypothetical protein